MTNGRCAVAVMRARGRGRVQDMLGSAAQIVTNTSARRQRKWRYEINGSAQHIRRLYNVKCMERIKDGTGEIRIKYGSSCGAPARLRLASIHILMRPYGPVICHMSYAHMIISAVLINHAHALSCVLLCCYLLYDLILITGRLARHLTSSE